ncbi:MAG: prolipoprotein diacylglyceryl transferase [Rickettsiales bacterium]|jgi:phosphatidylglycerol:prolipoprotein diacylglycerol transferase|nr:prolipoprotein diacylglyceryl transferase [Rickettsiales bacterium]
MEHMQLPIFNPNALDIGFLQIKWYSLVYILSLVLSWRLVSFLNKKYKLNLCQDEATFSDDYFFYGVLGLIIGGRLGYVFFYNFDYFMQNPVEIIEIWRGGMSFHGGLVGVLLGVCLLCKKHGTKPFLLFDILALGAPIALFFGRIANFINLELYGRVSAVPWAMIFPFTDGQPRHPSQLYEAFTEGLVLFLITLFATAKNKFRIERLNSALFLTFYGIFRIFTECFREPDAQIGFLLKNVTMGQLLTLPIFVFGCYLLYGISINRRNL